MPESLQPGRSPAEPSSSGGAAPDSERRGGDGHPPPHHASADADALPPGATDPSDHGALRRLDPGWVTAERISGAIGAGALTVGGLLAVLFFGGGWRLFGFGAWLALAIVLFTGALVAPALQYRRGRYRVSSFGIEIHWGVLWRRITLVPRSRIQHTDVEQGPLMRRFGIAKLVIHTAGTEHSTVPLYGLAMSDATAIRDDLMDRGGPNAWADRRGDGGGDGV